MKYCLGNSSKSTWVIVGVVHREVQMWLLLKRSESEKPRLRAWETQEVRPNSQAVTSSISLIYGVGTDTVMSQSVTPQYLPPGAVLSPIIRLSLKLRPGLWAVYVCVCVFLWGNRYGLTIIWTMRRQETFLAHLATVKMGIMRWPEPARIFSCPVEGKLRQG